jgi:hypothetical protein
LRLKVPFAAIHCGAKICARQIRGDCRAAALPHATNSRHGRLSEIPSFHSDLVELLIGNMDVPGFSD